MWKTIWALKMNLLHRGVVHNALCHICKREADTVKHILWSCPAAQDVWSCGPRKLQKGITEGLTFDHMFAYLINRCDMENLELMEVMVKKNLIL